MLRKDAVRNLFAAVWFICLMSNRGRSSMDTQNKHARIIPGMRYRNAPAAIEWLCKAFGFEKHLVVPGKDGKIDHARTPCTAIRWPRAHFDTAFPE